MRRGRDLEARGLDPAAARAEADRRFGDFRRVCGECEDVGREMVRRESRRNRWESLLQDIRLAARALRRSLGFTAVVV
jgi:hypothetical protein